MTYQLKPGDKLRDDNAEGHYIIADDRSVDYIYADGHRGPSGWTIDAIQSEFDAGEKWLIDSSCKRIEPKENPCPTSFPHLPHDYCDGKPGAPPFGTRAAAPNPFKEFPRPWKLRGGGHIECADGNIVWVGSACNMRDVIIAAVNTFNPETPSSPPPPLSAIREKVSEARRLVAESNNKRFDDNWKGRTALTHKADDLLHESLDLIDAAGKGQPAKPEQMDEWKVLKHVADTYYKHPEPLCVAMGIIAEKLIGLGCNRLQSDVRRMKREE